ncbi:UPF0421 protein [Halolactibacillus alkaliphilus]|uniref:UPF0421 protein n=1 Tax=Halolactibacillus alkaliphilus TaxID=442899 RepID=A0A511X2A2_9BACI|nr:aromatic acid exporter family protein [Halolactibacillus alkaliphilus]GEN57075.1 UPF0421 protein [Halolactibacillus alkaliphilus]GGN71815.1 UPF0421 protein [Halolactibacillus alkaliphilus]SFO87164.1 Uncharacterized membrane protein YgaE, UPF0421/DUF939 family [Halolactibacillus alkaliphilus]
MTLIETLIGRRVIKTALSVFFTALICQALNIPAVFAVMTAIVTVEPTAQDSFKKGLVRLPASAIGSFYAATFFHFFHISPLSYALAALFTIVTCYRLKLFDGLLVATLTSVAMVYVIDGRPIDAFFVRLLTTTIGLSVSTIVNFIILPPNYLKQITSEMDDVLYLAGIDLGYFAVSLQKRELDLIQAQTRKVFDTFQARLLKVEQLILNQQKESVYHNALYKQKTNIDLELKQLQLVKLMHYHIGNLTMPLHTDIEWSDDTLLDVVTIVNDLSGYLKKPMNCDSDTLKQHLYTLNHTFSQSAKREATLTDYLHAETVILYELIQLTELMTCYHELESAN